MGQVIELRRLPARWSFELRLDAIPGTRKEVKVYIRSGTWRSSFKLDTGHAARLLETLQIALGVPLK